MVGDDVVDLSDPETRAGAQHPRFDARVFAPAERVALAASAAPERLRWALWAAKEAAWKLARKRDPGVAFAPRRFLVSLGPELCGRVEWPGGSARVEVRSEAGGVHAAASDGAPAARRMLRGLARLGAGSDPSRAARELARERVAERLGLALAELRVEKRGRIPLLRCGPRRLDLSLSHHGRLVSFACDPGAPVPGPGR
jgi:hypothetical protein